MRIIGGSLRSRAIAAPKTDTTRPTSDRLRETLFNVLGQDMTGLHLADLYAGSGAVGIEALSRGAASVYFSEKSESALKTLRANLKSLNITSGFTIEAKGTSSLLSRLAQQDITLDIIFLDPPWDAADEYTTTLSFLGSKQAAKLVTPQTRVIAEHRSKSVLPAQISSLKQTRILKQGDAALSFYRLSD